MYTAASFKRAERGKQLRYSPMDEQMRSISCNEVVFSHEKKGNSDTCYNVGEP